MQRTSKQHLRYFPGILGKQQVHNQLQSRSVSCAHYVYDDIWAAIYYGNAVPPIYKARIVGV